MIAWKRAREGTDEKRDGYLVTWGHWQGGEEKEDGWPDVVGSWSFSCARPYSRSPVMSGFCRERSNHHSPSEWPARHRGVSRKCRRIIGDGMSDAPRLRKRRKVGCRRAGQGQAGQGREESTREETGRTGLGAGFPRMQKKKQGRTEQVAGERLRMRSGVCCLGHPLVGKYIGR